MNKPKFIFIIGFMASGKSTFGKRIAKELDYDFIDTDSFIEEKEGMTIPEIFEKYGEKYFRLLEKYATNELLKSTKSTVFSTGGGMSCNQHQLNKMLKNGKVIYLELNEKSIVSRLLESKSKRPIIDGLDKNQLKKKVKSLLNKRRKYYHQAHQFIKGIHAKKISGRELL